MHRSCEYVTRNGRASSVRSVRLSQRDWYLIEGLWQKLRRKYPRLSLNRFFLVLLDLGETIFRSLSAEEQRRILIYHLNGRRLYDAVDIQVEPVPAQERPLSTIVSLFHLTKRRILRVQSLAKLTGYRANDKEFRHQLKRLTKEGAIEIQQGGYVADSMHHQKLVRIIHDALWVNLGSKKMWMSPYLREKLGITKG